MKLLMFFVLPQFLSVPARGSPTNWSHDDSAVFFRYPDGNLQPANHSSTAPSCPGIKFIENLVHTTSSAGTSTAAAIKELPLRQRASGHGSTAAMKLLMFFVLPQFLSVPARGSPTNWSHDDGAVFFRHPDGNLQPANHSSTAPSCPGIKFIENLVHTTSSAGTSTAAAIKELPLRQRASGHRSSAAMKLLMFFVLPQSEKQELELGSFPECQSLGPFTVKIRQDCGPRCPTADKARTPLHSTFLPKGANKPSALENILPINGLLR
ncbi:uncharacterized protein ISCGN_006609 [Ixodes scapularis]